MSTGELKNGAGGPFPDPAGVADLPEFITLLDLLRVQAGEPSHRTLARRVGGLLRPPRTVAQSTVSAVFQTRRRRLDLDLLVGIVRALTGDEAVVDRWRQAYLRVIRDERSGGPAGVFRQLPAELATFTGREAVLRELVDGAADREEGAGPAGVVRVAAIEGMAGAGKTQLAVRAAHELVRAGRYTDVQLFVNLHGFDPEHPPAEPATVLAAFLRQLGVAAEQIPQETAERAAMFRDRLHGRDALLLLDNAAGEEQVRDLIPAWAGCLVLITSRRSLAGLDGAIPHRLEVFDPRESVTLLARLAGRDRIEAEPEAAREVAALCGHLPLALALAGARLRARPAWSAADLAGRLRTGISTLATAGQSLPAMFELSYRGLAEPDRHLFRALGLHPGLDFTAESVAALADVGVADAERILETLCDEHLVLQRTPGRYELHDLVRVYAHERSTAETAPADRSAAIARTIAWYAESTTAAAEAVRPGRRLPPRPGADAPGPGPAPAPPDPDRARAFYEHERATLVRIVQTAVDHGLHHLAWYLPVAMQALTAAAADWPQMERVSQLALGAAEACGDEAAQAWVLWKLGSSRAHGLDPAGGLEPLARAAELFRRVGDRAMEGQVLGGTSWALSRTGEPELALQTARAAFAIHREVGDGPAELGALTTMASCLLRLGRPGEAVAPLQEGIARAGLLGRSVAVSTGLRNLGRTYIILERFAPAQTALEEAAEISGRIGEQFTLLEALNGIAWSLCGQGREEDARKRYRESLDLLDSLPPALADRYRGQLETSSLRFAAPPGFRDAPDGAGDLVVAVRRPARVPGRAGRRRPRRLPTLISES